MLLFLIELLKATYNKIRNYSFELYSRLFLRNNVDKKIIDIIEQAKKQYNKTNLKITDVNDAKFYNKSENLKSFIIEVFLYDENKNNFNSKQNLYKIKGYTIAGINTIIEFNKKNSDDLGEIIPENTNKYFF